MKNLLESEIEVCVHVFISGTVQGVGYRFFTVKEAKRLGIKGWVQNLPDRRVEAVFEASQANVEEMILRCHQGPPGAVVKEVLVEYETPQGLQGFETR